ncbi:hypothetical protein T01_7186 [Trichinella spiralis]|uniref:Uncharacterized protein n=1 Tax=Trichinella spiralis TaxID=6334 RepID=A0A0V1AXK4_TRISP|nr:hypothetical protein T01_7186 [Trichinella spiralis]
MFCSIFHNDGLSNDDLKQLAELRTDNKPTVIDSKEDISLRTNRILLMSSKARRDVLEMISCYQEIRHERKHRKRQLTLDSFITKKSKTLLCMYAVDLQVQCKVVSAYVVPHYDSNEEDNIRMKGKEVLRTGSWLTAAPVPRFQTLAPDWSTSPDMSGSAEFPLSC